MGQKGGSFSGAGVRQSDPATSVQPERHRADGLRQQTEPEGDVRDQAVRGAAQRHQVQVAVSQVPAEITFQIPGQNLLWWLQGKTLPPSHFEL